MKLTRHIPEPVIPPEEYVLRLTRDEAKVLFNLCGEVSGHGPVRDIVSQVYEAFAQVFGEDSFQLFTPTKDGLRANDKYPSE